MTSDYPVFSVPLEMRCHELVELRPRAFCGRWARWFRAGNRFCPDGFFCEAHRGAIDIRIPDTIVYRRVRVTCDVTIAAVSLTAREAEAEAVTVLQAAAAKAGGVLNLHGVTSHVGRYGLFLPRREAIGAQDRPE